MLLEERKEGQEDKEEELSNRWTMLRERKNNRARKKEHWITLSGELALEEAMDLL
jgi:hypothetical protein